MNIDLILVLLLLGAAIGMFVANRPRMDAVALIMIAVMPLTGVLTINEALAGFSDPNIVLIAALFVIGEGLVRTGVARLMGDWLNARAGRSETRMLVLLMLASGFLGAFMSSTAVVAIFIPVVLRICQNTGTAPSQLMMPLSIAALMSGMMTLVATAPNLVVNAELVRQGGESFGFFAFTPFGLPMLIIGTAYMLFARRLLPSTKPVLGRQGRPSLPGWVEQYGLNRRAYRVRIMMGSPLVGQKLDDLELRASGVNLLAIEIGGRFSTEVIRPMARTVLEAGHIMLLDVILPDVEIEALREKYRLQILPLGDGGYVTDRSQEIGMVEVIIPADSPLVGQTVLQARVRSESGLTVIGLRRGRKVLSEGLLEEQLKVGDTLLLTGFWSDIRNLQSEPSEMVVLSLPAEMEEVLPAASKAPQAVAILALTIGLMISGLVPNVHAALIGCLLMGAFGCLDMNSAYRSISWKSLILIVGMLPFSLALQRTGGVELAAEAVTAIAGNASPRMVLGLLFLITAMLGLFISNTATAVLMAPVALAVARDMGASPYPFAMIIALAASTAFMTPISSPVNTLVVGPGNYGFGDFVKVGVPLSLIVMAVSVLMVPILLPL
ncbi:sodium-coupled transporter [Roseococcus sp. SYP-B2431]|uniref:SLC13 family permease n=1 Tax=Roseococcus sp. SYP-B2431 TaxID=2496640 RepID=UPI001038B1B3|nr:SLC13 family permease [Roseococcus sp. SYP-B2431]TCI00010.1 sodium-coupled transporter [Roseococcus sp. SYP-B2431]